MDSLRLLKSCRFGIRLLRSTTLVSKGSRRNMSTRVSVKKSVSPKPVNTASKEGTNKTDIFNQFSWIGQHTPVFGVSGDSLEVLPTPTDFYETLKEEALGAKRRIVLASLYLGTGKLEQELVDAIYESCQRAKEKGKRLDVLILLDCNRGSRGDKNSRTMLIPLLRDFGDMVKVSLFHTPDLRGWLKKILPEKYNETIGISHLKLYLFDDNFIMSGANLSNDYFTNRQDRYILFKYCPDIADFYCQLIETVASLSFHLFDDNTLALPEGLKFHPYLDSDGGKGYREEAKMRIQSVIQPTSQNLNDIIAKEKLNVISSDVRLPPQSHENSQNCSTENDEKSNLNTIEKTTKRTANSERDYLTMKPALDGDRVEEHRTTDIQSIAELMNEPVDDYRDKYEVDTLIFPLTQMAPFGISVDDEVTRKFLKHAEKDSTVFLASGYFNLTEDIMEVILSDSASDFNFLMASPEVNGFYKAKGIIGSIPDAYTYIEKQFYQRIKDRNLQGRLSMYEFHKEKWTFHAKGLWYYLPGEELPSLSFIGSPNFGYRSLARDLESQVIIVTTNESLQRQLHQEQLQLYSRGREVTDETFKAPDRYTPLWVTYVTNIIRNFF